MAGPQWSTNLLHGNASTFDTSTGHWVGNGSTQVRQVPLVKQAGTGSLGVFNGGSGFGTSQATGPLIPAKAGSRYAFNFWVLASQNVRGVDGEIVFVDSTGRQFEPAYGEKTKESTKAWTRVPDTVAIAPPDTVGVLARVNIYGVTPGELHFVDTATLEEARGSSFAVAGPLHTAGNQVYDGHGVPIRLRGFVRWGMQTGPVAPTVTPDDIAHAKAWGANIIRLPLGSQLWLSGNCHTDPNYISKVDYAVDTITGMGMYVLLDLHWNMVTYPCGPAQPYPMADSAGGIPFWTQVANRYKDNPRVGFDLYNEPHNINNSVYLNGGTVTWKSQTYHATGMQAMYNAVRSTGAQNLVFVTGQVWGNNFPPLISGFNIVYSVHAYTCPGSPPPKCTNTNPYDGSQFLKNWVTPGKTHPVFVGEFGWPQDGSGRYNGSVIAFAEQQHWGWSDFTWGNNTRSRFTLIREGAGTAYEPAPSGMPALETFPGT
jgi:hypothetical protein